tara:strand:+ start:212 stop:907 length:696 start_codon:yes stop_codon:yes gene_type:complete
MVKVLELFSGTRSIGKCCDKLGWESYSVDLISDADFKGNIMDFDFKQFPKDEFDIVWASPPCSNYSKLQDCWLGRMRKGELYSKEIQEKEMNDDDKLVLRAIEIIEYFNPEYWFIENPASSKMKDRIFMKDKPFYLVDYCMYSDWGYRKRTRIWTNKKDWKNKLCDGKGTCGNMTDSHHNLTADGGYDKRKLLHKTNLGNTERKQKTKGIGTTQNDRYRIPEDLIFSLFLD